MKELEKLKKDIRRSLVAGEATFALDRLHTLTIKKIRSYCLLHEIDIVSDSGDQYPLHSLVGMLIKHYAKNNLISEFTEQSLKQSISIYEKFNDIRNNKSFAHDNDVLSNEESLYVVNCVMNMLNFLNYIETGESQLISDSVVGLEDVYKYICLNYGVTTKQIADEFSVSIDEIKDILMELYKVNEVIRPAHLGCIPDDDDCEWSKYR